MAMTRKLPFNAGRHEAPMLASSVISAAKVVRRGLQPEPRGPITILAIDPGNTGGWCIRTPGSWSAGAAKSAVERRGVCDAAILAADTNHTPLIVVAEQWTAGGVRGHLQWVGLGSAWGRWAEALELAGVPKSRIVRVYPQTWRKVLAGLPRRTGKEAKASAQLVARSLLHRDVGTDEAEAVCIARWSETATEVTDVARVKRRITEAQALARLVAER
jgi:hypothetical protein